jgi:hypothetical protein
MSETYISEAEAKQMKRDQAAAGAIKKWQFIARSTPQAARDFVNSPPSQGAGEAVFINLPNGHVGVFYYIREP